MKALLPLAAALILSATCLAKPVRLIFDTDMGNDIDDAMALAMIHNLERRGACQLLAVTSTKDHPKSAAFIDALNMFYGQPDIPIGLPPDPIRLPFTCRIACFRRTCQHPHHENATSPQLHTSRHRRSG